VAVDVGVGVGLLGLDVPVGVGVWVLVGVGVNVLVGVGVGVKVRVGVGVKVGVGGTGVNVGVGVGVKVGVGGTGVNVGVGVGVKVGVGGMGVNVGVGVLVLVGVGVKVLVGVGVKVFVGVGVKVRVGVAVDVAVGVKVLVGVAVGNGGQSPSTWIWLSRDPTESPSSEMYFRWNDAPEIEEAPRPSPQPLAPAPTAMWPPNHRPTFVSMVEVLKLTSIFTLLLPQFWKQSGSLSDRWASPGSSPPSRLGKVTVTVGGSGQEGEQPKRIERETGSSRAATASNGSDGISRWL